MPGKAADLAMWNVFTKQLHIHHRAEDTALWPPLRAAAISPADASTLDAMELEHAQIDPHLEQIQHAIDSSDPEALKRSIQLLTDGLATHMRHEENAALPLIETYLGPAGWAAFTTTFRETQGIRGAATYFPWLLDDAPKDVRTKVLAMLPPPARVLYRTVWAPRYRRGRR
jgi:iron-sulfur cluster repair protein YtfE (RIC family)